MTGEAEEVWHLAVCQDCTPVLPQPFLVEGKRDEWAHVHRGGTGHRVICIKQTLRPKPREDTP